MVVVDTNVFVGACLGVGPSAAVVELALRGSIRPVMGNALFAEYEDVLSRPEVFASSRLRPDEREELFDIFCNAATWCLTYYRWRPNLRDEGDNHIVELAVASGASRIVTWNVKDFKHAQLRFPAVQVLSPIDFMKDTK